MLVKKYLTLFFIVLVAVSTSGCAAALLGAGAAGTYAMVQGSAEGYSDVGYDKMWGSAHAALKKMGAVVSEDPSGGRLRAKVAGSDVTVDFTKITESTTKMRVNARKNLFPNEKLAEELYTSIAKDF